MKRYFNTEGCCYPEDHYMVNLDSRLEEIKTMIEAGKYFTINRGRQYGKTTILKALKKHLSDDYIILSLDFQSLSMTEFSTEENFVKAFARELWKRCRDKFTEEITEEIKKMRLSREYVLADLFLVLNDWCCSSEKPIVMIIDEVDQASNNQVFLDFLAQLRVSYLERKDIPTFKSVILAGVHDIRNIRRKIRPDDEHRHNSPWNISAEFKVDMSFSVKDIENMLIDYENDNHTGMDTNMIANLIYDYTSGYPVLVSLICKINDEQTDDSIRWNKQGVISAVSRMISTKQPLFDSLINKLEDNEMLRNQVYSILVNGDTASFDPYNSAMDLAFMYGFINVSCGIMHISNRIFETILYNYFLTSNKMQSMPIYEAGSYDKSQFTENGVLDMEKVLEKFTEHFNEIMGDKPEKFLEEKGREYFLLYLRPIINGTGNYYIEAQTRDHRRMDIVVDYLGVRHIIELKIWRGEEYNRKGEEQLCEYLEKHNIKKGYLVSFCFNKNKKPGIYTIQNGDKVIVEAVV